MANSLKLLVLIFSLLSCRSNNQELKEEHTQKGNDVISYWDKQRKGTNHFNQIPSKEWFDAANKANIKFVRLVFEKWEGEQRDFILGNADDYQGIVESDFQKLLYFLDYANELDIKVVITPISLPGDRWIQSNDDKQDGRLWKDLGYRQQAITYWKDLASRLKGNPAVVGYNLMNEPHPEFYYDKHDFWKRDIQDWYKSVEGSPGDLNLFNKQMVKAIRSVDTQMPIIVESGLYATPWAFDYMQPLEDEKIIYSFHMYEPYRFTTKRINKGRFNYLGSISIEGLEEPFELSKEGLSNFLKPINEWAQKNKVPSNRIWVGEFGCDRSLKGAEIYLNDLMSIFNENNWHWSFYSYREDDGWQALDYELGKQEAPSAYWEYQESQTMHLHYDEIYHGVEDSFWEIFQKEFK